jgi:hypothetical protein
VGVISERTHFCNGNKSTPCGSNGRANELLCLENLDKGVPFISFSVYNEGDLLLAQNIDNTCLGNNNIQDIIFKKERLRFGKNFG